MKKRTIFLTLAAVCTAIVIAAFGVAAHKHFFRPLKNKTTGVAIGNSNLRYIYGEYIYNPKTGKKLIENIDWLFESADDTIGILAKDGKRAYINLNTAELITALDYDKAWAFSCNRGVMVRNDSVFIFRRDGSIVNTTGLPYQHEYELLFFNNNLVLHGTPETVGVIDTSAQWVLQPEYKSIEMNYTHELYNTRKQDLWEVLTFDLKPVLTGKYRDVTIDWSEGIIATENNGIEHLFSYEGKMIYEVIYQSIGELTYKTDKKDSDGDPIYAPTNCYVYKAYNGKCGLMNRQYHILTPPQFKDIEAQTAHIFFATFGEYSSRFGTLIDELGKPIR